MTKQPEHTKWLIDTGQRLKTADGKPVQVWIIRHQPDEAILSAWAAHFRSHYCADGQIDQLRQGTGLSRRDYLNNIKFPSDSDRPGPSIRSGDFGEILVADYVEFLLGYWVPRTRYSNKAVRNESVKGCDIVGLRFADENVESPGDALIIFEVKASLSEASASSKLQEAIDDSCKDLTRKAETLNAMKQRFLDAQNAAAARRVERFQNPIDKPYREESGASAVLSDTVFEPSVAAAALVNRHPNQNNLQLVIFVGRDLLNLVRELYRRAADEA